MTSRSLGARLRALQNPQVRQRPLRLAVDFDGVMHGGSYGDIGEPLEGARGALLIARSFGDHIIIHTCRARPTETIDGVFWKNTVEEIEHWMAVHDIPFDEITALKPIADCYLDDRAIQFIDWHQAQSDLAMMRRQK